MKTKAILLLIIIYLAFIALGLPDAIIGAAWNLMRNDFNVTLGALSAVSFLTYVMSLIATLNAPRLLRLLETKNITAVSIIFTGLALILMSQVNHFYQLLLLAIPLGIGAGAIDVSLNHYMAKHYKASHMNYLHSFYGVGVTLGPAIIAYTLQEQAWRLGFMIVGIILLSIALLTLFSFPLWHKEKVVERASEHAHIPINAILKSKGLVISILIFLFYVHIETLGGIWIASYFFIEKSVSYASAALFTTTFYLSLTTGRFLSGFLTHKVAPKTLVIIGNSLIVLGSLLLIINRIESTIVHFIIVFMIGFGCAPIYPNLMFINKSYFTKKQLSKVISLQMAVGYIGFGLLTPLAGIIFDYFSITLYPYWIFLVSLLTLFLLIRYLSNKPIIKA